MRQRNASADFSNAWKSNVSTKQEKEKNYHKFNRNLNEAWKSFKFYQLGSCGFVVLFNVFCLWNTRKHTWKCMYLELPVWHINKWWVVCVKTTLKKHRTLVECGTFFRTLSLSLPNVISLEYCEVFRRVRRNNVSEILLDMALVISSTKKKK